ncbi:hypothetical protein GTQ34_13395 [Muricauda sp. JGD-17]|uniref:Secreted protein n=1 Tax=Flagellimonas ochracea TaxID=2696472 RepID=A0A964TDN0_9FLAO|nr:hypothetical protein [Allomuricauda ochracea]NAY92912.1 hypothetical protein [Allomuricauda ochracea]
MKLKIIYIVLFSLGISGSVNGQLNSYKYIIVPKKFEAFKSENMHLTSTMVKHYFSQYGFNAVYDDALQADLIADPCLGVTAQLLDFSSLFATKAVVVLTDCEGKEVFRTMEGRSKEKEYREAYKEALENSFVSFDGMDYKYIPMEKSETKTKKEEPITISFKDDVKSVDNAPKPKIVEQKATPEEQLYKNREPVSSNMVKVEPNERPLQNETQPVPSSEDFQANDILIAQPSESGYYLLDSASNVVLKLQETSMQDIFLADYMGNNAVVFKKEGKWVLEYAENGEKHLKELNIRF